MGATNEIATKVLGPNQPRLFLLIETYVEVGPVSATPQMIVEPSLVEEALNDLGIKYAYNSAYLSQGLIWIFLMKGIRLAFSIRTKRALLTF